MSCVNLAFKETTSMERNDTNRRTSRGLASCLRGETEEYIEAAGKIIYFLKLFFYYVYINVNSW